MPMLLRRQRAQMIADLESDGWQLEAPVRGGAGRADGGVCSQCLCTPRMPHPYVPCCRTRAVRHAPPCQLVPAAFFCPAFLPLL